MSPFKIEKFFVVEMENISRPTLEKWLQSNLQCTTGQRNRAHLMLISFGENRFIAF